MIATGGWDNNVIFYDTRSPKPVSSFIGPHVCGESLDFNGNSILCGSYRSKKNLTIWDKRKPHKTIETVNWFGSLETQDPSQNDSLLYAAMYNRNNKDIFAAGGNAKNEVRIF